MWVILHYFRQGTKIYWTRKSKMNILYGSGTTYTDHKHTNVLIRNLIIMFSYLGWVLGGDFKYCCGRIPAFQRSMLPPSSEWNNWWWEKNGHRYKPGVQVTYPWFWPSHKQPFSGSLCNATALFRTNLHPLHTDPYLITTSPCTHC